MSAVFRPVVRLWLALLASTLALPDDAWAQKKGSFGGGHHHRRVFVGSTFYFGPPMWYAYPGPYYYAPVYIATETEPTVYVEKFDGTPSADAGEIYCPSMGGHYPDVQDCPNGWQRIIRAPESATEGG
jgi:hypothetical protein